MARESSFGKGLGLGCGTIIGIVVGLLLLGGIVIFACTGLFFAAAEKGAEIDEGKTVVTKSGSEPAKSESMPEMPVRRPKITRAQYQQIANGMTYDEVVKIAGNPSEELSRVSIGDIETVMYVWKNWDGTNMTATFQNGKLAAKAQFGLK